MPPRGRPKAELTLSDAERRTLQGWSAQPGRADRRALRARIVLASAAGLTNTDVADGLDVTSRTVGKWRARFVRHRLSGLADDPRPGAGRRITPAQIEAVLVRTSQTAPPSGADQWSTRSMADAVGLNQTAVSRIWRAAGLGHQPLPTWRLFQDPEIGARIRQLAGLRLTGTERIVALALERRPTQSITGCDPGERAALDRRRDDLLAALRAIPLARSGPAPDGPDPGLLRFLIGLDTRVPPDQEVHVALCGGRPTVENPAVRDWAAARPRFHLHPVPVPDTWQRLAERSLARLARRGALAGTAGLAASLPGRARAGETDPEPYVWFAPSSGEGWRRVPARASVC
ncbi:helix-turn-helix domain-containing protein [Micromonospora sp. RTGN7]|uniref:helix-turn-helix domain-containing protein n=1 Tax=Micromonospora sp. RTGN7 TaxID=3016526 RepID=UPI0029FF0F9D|nr:helix-turn-helix domain-containing protein [Micromonospora sp. RTGN7]